MPGWNVASFAFFAYVILAAPLVPGLALRRRRLALAGAGTGLALSALAYALPHTIVLHEWMLPPLIMLIGYWASGQLFAAPMPRAEQALDGLDRALRVDRAAAMVPRWLAELLELSYVAVYPLIPIALVVHVFGTAAPDPQRFWTVILVTDYACFGFLPWIQTRPPRALRTADPWTSLVRRVNLGLLGRTSIQVNTFPSGHAAEGLATALLVLGAPVPWVAGIAITGLLVSAGAVLGRYHYAADAFSGWIVAAAVWLMV